MVRMLVISTMMALMAAPLHSAQIDSYNDYSLFASQFSSVQVYSQNPLDSGATDDGIHWHVSVGDIEFEFGGYPYYRPDWPEAGIDVLSKSVTVTLTPNDSTVIKGLGFYIYQYSLVDISAFDDDGDSISIVDFSNGGGAGSSAFIGFTSNSGISRIEIGGNPDHITNVGQVVVAGAAPIPATACLFDSSDAVIIHDTITGRSKAGSHLVGMSNSGSGVINQPADSFVVSGGDFFLDSLSLGLYPSGNAGGGTPDNYVIRLWDNDNDRPGSLLESFIVPNSDSINNLTVLRSIDQSVLVDGATYWVSAALPDDLSSGSWVMADTPSSGYASAMSGAESATWTYTSSPSWSLAMQISATPISEIPVPDTACLFGPAVLGLGADIQEIYVGLLSRAADKPGFDYWEDKINRGALTIEQLRASIVNKHPEYINGIGSFNREDTVKALYQNLFRRDPDAAGLDYWVDGGGASVNTDQLILAMSDGASTEDRAILNNKILGASYYTNNKGSDALYDPGLARAVVVHIDSTSSSLDASRAITNAIPVNANNGMMYVAHFGNGLGDCGPPENGYNLDVRVDGSQVATLAPGEQTPVVLQGNSHTIEFVQQNGVSSGSNGIDIIDHDTALAWSCGSLVSYEPTQYRFAATQPVEEYAP